jgi:Raf kinase inhibitor-like YbhB/YbcL family protein
MHALIKVTRGYKGGQEMEISEFRIESVAFKNSENIPEDFTAHGKNISPPLKWDGVPRHAQELALICEDPDAPKNPPFVHWVVYHIPVETKQIDENASEYSNGTLVLGKNSAGEETYIGPNPSENSGNHRYYFRLFALDSPVNLKKGASADELMEAMRGHIIAEADVMGKHQYH